VIIYLYIRGGVERLKKKKDDTHAAAASTRKEV